MLIKITFQLMILILSVSFTQAQYFESVEKETERILISLSDGDSINPSELNQLKNLISAVTRVNEYISFPNVNQKNIDSLITHLDEFETESKNISTDSAFVLFNDWYLHLQNIFYDYSKEKFFSSPKKKILLFSTSMSCYCTLKMCREQTVELLKFISENDNKYDYWVIDSYWYNDLQIKYETLFSPSVIVFGGNNQVLDKIEYDEKMITLLTDYFNIKH